MMSLASSRTRAGLLVIALGLVGGTGCITTAIVQNVQSQNRLREQEAQRQRRVAALTPRAEAGDPVAMTALAEALIAQPDPAGRDPARVLDWLGRAAVANYAPAQALLGEILANGAIRWNGYGYQQLPAALRDRERGVALLRQAATQACRYRFESVAFDGGLITPTAELQRLLASAGRTDDAALWRARGILHCGLPSGYDLVVTAKSATALPRQRSTALALMLLVPDASTVASTEAAMPADQVAAAVREAADLRARVAASEDDFPAPPRKELP